MTTIPDTVSYEEISRQRKEGSHIKIEQLNQDEKTAAWHINEYEKTQLLVGCQYLGAEEVISAGLTSNPNLAAR